MKQLSKAKPTINRQNAKSHNPTVKIVATPPTQAIRFDPEIYNNIITTQYIQIKRKM